MKTRKLVAAALCAALLSGQALAETVSATNPQSVANALSAAGYRAEVAKDDDGDPLVRSTSSGSNFVILFFGCTGGRGCTTVQFYAGWNNNGKTSLGTINEWNKSKRFARAYLNDKSNPAIEMDVDLDDGGMSSALFTDNLEFWVALMAAFEKHIGV